MDQTTADVSEQIDELTAPQSADSIQNSATEDCPGNLNRHGVSESPVVIERCRGAFSLNVT
ncbi:MAG: hypothetical protein ACLFSB_10515 [Chitinispirillaceae bacterium]